MEPSYKTLDLKNFATGRPTLHKSHNVGNRYLNIDKSVTYDDLILYKSVPSFKIHKISIISDDAYVYGIQTIYLNEKTQETYSGAIVSSNLPQDCQIKTLTIDEDDYICKISGLSGAVIDNLCFETRKGKILQGGGSGGDSFVVTAKNDYYFSNFGSTLSSSDHRLMALHFEEIPIHKIESTFINEIRNFKNFRKIFKLCSEFLSLRDLIQIFSVNSHFYSLRFDPFYVYSMAMQIIKSMNNQHRVYLKNLMNDERVKNNEEFNTIRKILAFTSNKIKNPYGCLGFEGWEKIKQGFAIETFMTQPYRTHCFAGTYFLSVLSVDFIFKEAFDEDFIKEFLKGNNLIVAGGMIARRPDCPSEGFVELKAFAENDEVIFEKKQKYEELKNDYQLISVKYYYDDKKDKIPFKLTFSFGGADQKFWAGNYGPRFSGLFVRGYKKEFFN